MIGQVAAQVLCTPPFVLWARWVVIGRQVFCIECQFREVLLPVQKTRPSGRSPEYPVCKAFLVAIGQLCLADTSHAGDGHQAQAHWLGLAHSAKQQTF